MSWTCTPAHLLCIFAAGQMEARMGGSHECSSGSSLAKFLFVASTCVRRAVFDRSCHGKRS